ncbi:hypothetical protein [Vreelandella sp. V005]|uniref:hypothetical protein n=1 Tax=Vreelandella sp. V005 TaxID=3459608 RepID=UPI00404498F9
MHTVKAIQPTHAGNSCGKKVSQVLVKMTPAERAELESIAELEQRSLSGATRIMIQRGISQYKTESLIAD